MAEYLYFIMTCVCHLFALINNLIYSDINSIYVLFEYSLVMVGCIFMYLVYIYTKKDNSRLLKRFHINVRYRYFHTFVFILALATLLFYLHTGVGRAESYVQASYSQLFSVLNINTIIWIYYFLCRERHKSNLFWINIAIYILYRLLQGWSAILLEIFFFELYFLLKRHGVEYKKIGVKRTILCIISIGLIIIGGGIVYSYASPIKYMIRYFAPLSEVQFLSWGEGISRLTSRLTYLDSAVKTSIYGDRIIEIYKSQGNDFIELLSILRPLVPRSIMPNKEFQNLGSCVYTGISGIKNINISDSNGIINYAYLLFAINPIVAILWFVFFAIIYCSIREILGVFEEEPGQFEMLIFYITFGLSKTGNIEVQFTQTYLKLFFFIPILFLLGIIRLYKKTT